METVNESGWTCKEHKTNIQFFSSSSFVSDTLSEMLKKCTRRVKLIRWIKCKCACGCEKQTSHQNHEWHWVKLTRTHRYNDSSARGIDRTIEWETHFGILHHSRFGYNNYIFHSTRSHGIEMKSAVAFAHVCCIIQLVCGADRWAVSLKTEWNPCGIVTQCACLQHRHTYTRATLTISLTHTAAEWVSRAT